MKHGISVVEENVNRHTNKHDSIEHRLIHDRDIMIDPYNN